MVFLVNLILSASLLLAQEPRALTLEQAQEFALRNHPRIASASLNAQAAGETVKQVRSAFQPLLSGNLTTVGAESGTSIAAGTLQTSGLSSRAATGLGISQLVTDFGRTSNLAESARFRAGAQQSNVDVTRAQVLLQVQQAYYSTLSAQEVLKVARARVEMNRLTVRQVGALAGSGIKSTLDVSFAEVALSEAELALFKAENDAKVSSALLAVGMGEQTNTSYTLADVPTPQRVTAEVDSLVQEALKNRPEVSAAKLNQSAAERFAEAERKLKYPAITAVASVGAVPLHQSSLADHYNGAGLNIMLPFLNGGLYASRRAEAQLRARGADKDTQAIGILIAGGVRTSWLEAETAWRKIDVTARLVDQTTTALRLAQTRYETGLSGILELTQSQLALVAARIAAANAKYDYLIRVANLNFAIGALR